MPSLKPIFTAEDFLSLARDLNAVQAIRAGIQVERPIADPDAAIAALDDAEKRLSEGGAR